MQGKLNKTKSITTISHTANVRGDIAGEKQIEIYGSLSGNVSTLESIVVRSSASIEGSLETSELLIESGARAKCFIRVSPPAKEWNKWSRLWQR